MAHTFHAQRAEHRTGRATRAAQMRAADAIVSTLDEIAERRAEQHRAELARARGECAEHRRAADAGTTRTILCAWALRPMGYDVNCFHADTGARHHAECIHCLDCIFQNLETAE